MSNDGIGDTTGLFSSDKFQSKFEAEAFIGFYLAHFNITPFVRFDSGGAFNQDYLFKIVENEDGTFSIAIARVYFVGSANSEQEATDLIAQGY